MGSKLNRQAGTGFQQRRSKNPEPILGLRPRPEGGNQRLWALALLLIALTFAAYYPVLNHPFVNYDDPDYVTGNPHIQPGVTFATLRWALLSTEQANWHPVTWISHALDCDLFGLEPAGHHFTSLLLHALNVGLLFVLLVRATGMAWRSFLVAAVFALHPINVESVAWVAERKTVLSMFFCLLAVGAYGWYARRPGVGRYWAVFVLFLLALAAKPMVVTLPFALLLLDFWPLQRVAEWSVPSATALAVSRLPLRRLILEKLPLLVLAAASSAITIVAQHRALKTTTVIPIGARAANAVFSYRMYLWKTVWPLRLGVFYSHRGLDLAGWQVGLSLVFLALVSALVWRMRSRGYLWTGWLWYLGTLVPMIGLVQVGEQGMADRYAYLPLLGVFTMAVWGLGDLADKSEIGFRPRAAAAVVVLLTLSLLTHRQLQTWESSFTLWSHSLLITPENYVAEDFIGSTLLTQAYQASGESCADEALQHFENAVRINPQDSLGHLNVGFCRQARGRLQEAIEEYKIALHTTHNKYLKGRAYLNLGAAYDAAGDFEASRQSFNDGLSLYPNDREMRAGLSQMQADEKMAEGARRSSKSPQRH
jgi:hypothetical protein